uniref:C2H2-type domain-containing protein n=1 Tax=viral metagenome TaxID=1070528 RepID=A0A6C0J5S6_9ZZZZ
MTKKHKCSYCKYETDKFYNLQRHCNNKHGIEIFELNQEFPISSVNEDLEINENNCNDNIIKYKCEKCSKCYLTAKFYNEHIKVCKGLNILTCERCMFTFKTKQSKSNHKLRNNCKPKSAAFANDIPNITNNNTTNNTINNNTNITNNINNITNNYYITNNFEKERLDYITKEAIYEKCFKACFPILKLIELIHFNNDYPENQNIRYDNKKKIINVKKDNGWATIDYNYLIYNLFINNSKLLTNYYNDYKDYFDNLINDVNHIEELIIYLNHNMLEQIHPKKFLLMTKETKNTIKNFESLYPMN